MNKKYKVVLVCSDNFINDFYKTKFKKSGMELIAINKTDKCFIEKMAKLSPDLILMGILMISVDGYELTEMLKSDSRTKNIRLIGFSNMSAKEEIEKGLKLGMEDYWSISKYSPDEIIAKVKKLS